MKSCHLQVSRTIACSMILIAAGSALGVPDGSVSGIPSVTNLTSGGAVDGRRAYSFGVQFCNPGTIPLLWSASTPNHPVSSPNLYRLSAGRFEQIGIGFCHHEFFALGQGGVCGTCTPTDGATLGVGCMTPTTSGIASNQQNLSPRSQANPSTGALVFPFVRDTGAPLYKRLSVSEADAGVPGASYFVEQATVHLQDTASTTIANNYGYRPISFAPGSFNISFGGAFVGQPAIYAWKAADPSVEISVVDVPGEGRFILGAKATDLGSSQWGYEYALQNISSHCAAGRFTIGVDDSASVSGIGFHDVDYHSGEPFDNTDWTSGRGTNDVFWHSPQDFASNPNSNALRWGTIYNFRLVSNTPPTMGVATITLFRPCSPSFVTTATIAPAAVVPACPGDADGDGLVGLSDIAAISTAWGAMVIPGTPPDLDGSGDVGLGDIALVVTNWGAVCP